MQAEEAARANIIAQLYEHGQDSAQAATNALLETEAICRDEPRQKLGYVPILSGSEPSSQPETTTTQTTTTPTTTNIATGAPDPHSSPAFVIKASTQQGDKVRIEGRFGKVLQPAESDVDQAALGECTEVSGRELVVQLDLVATLESSLQTTASLEFEPSRTGVNDYLVEHDGALTCKADVDNPAVEFGNLQPGQSSDATTWVILPRMISPNDPHPSPQQIGQQSVLEPPLVKIEGGATSASLYGSRVITCEPQGSNGTDEESISAAGTIPISMTGGNPGAAYAGSSETLCKVQS
ncbi:MAG TPA: hypothetical protein VMR75_00960 [Candidatus Saccharimonadales bacterium]|nr:hypothetical protein [Candidatus Saccharimonadales bacterium]